MELTAEELQANIPQYLTEDLKKGFIEALNRFPHIDYYTPHYASEMLQGDGWSGFPIVNLETKASKDVRGIVLSNTCDVAPENKRLRPPRVVFAPLIPLQTYEQFLLKSNCPADKVRNQIASIREQHITNVFYLPAGAGLDEEHIVYLDDLYNVPLKHLLTNTGRTKVFTLSQVGFYLFLMKLSIHFCRMHEGVLRDVAGTA